MTKLFSLTYKNDSSLIEGCRKKDPLAQQKLFSVYNKKMMGVCIRYLKNEEEAFEVLNAAFFKIFDKINQFKPETKLEAWIRRIVINTTIDYIRKNKSYKKYFIKTNEFNEYGEPNDGNDDISEFWDKANAIPEDVLLQTINKLPTATRVVFNLYAIDGHTHQQIAKQLNISTGTSKWHLSNARKLLKEKLIEIINKGTYQNERKTFKKY